VKQIGGWTNQFQCTGRGLRRAKGRGEGGQLELEGRKEEVVERELTLFDLSVGGVSDFRLLRRYEREESGRARDRRD